MFDQFKPILRLRINGFCCPCLESEDEHATRLAELSLKSVPIRWYRKIKTKPADNAAEGSLIDRIASRAQCGRCGKQVDAEEKELVPLAADGDSQEHSAPVAGRKSPKPRAPSSYYIGIDATLDVFDTSSGPAIYVTSREFQFVDDDISVPLGVSASGSNDKPAVMRKIVPLQEVGDVSPGHSEEWNALGIGDVCRCGVVMSAAPPEDGLGGSGRKLLIFEVLEGDRQHIPARDEVVRHLNTLIKWDRARITKFDAKKKENTCKKEEDRECEDDKYELMDDREEGSVATIKKQNKSGLMDHPTRGKESETEVMRLTDAAACSLNCVCPRG